jgi:hypothetical protein
MKPSLILFSSIATLTFGLLVTTGQAGGGKASAWKPFLTDESYKELTTRSIKLIEENAKAGGKNAADRIEAEAAILAGYTLSSARAKDEEASRLRGAALAAAERARKVETIKLVEFGKMVASAAKQPAEIKDFTTYLHATEPMMKMFLSKAKGGEGIHPDLQYQPKLKNLNGIEALLGGLATKKLSDDNLTKVSKELPLLAYRIAVVGSVTHELAPKKDAGKWREFSITMRDSSLALADAAQKKNSEGLMKAALALENSCIECHSEYKK